MSTTATSNRLAARLAFAASRSPTATISPSEKPASNAASRIDALWSELSSRMSNWVMFASSLRVMGDPVGRDTKAKLESRPRFPRPGLHELDVAVKGDELRPDGAEAA